MTTCTSWDESNYAISLRKVHSVTLHWEVRHTDASPVSTFEEA